MPTDEKIEELLARRAEADARRWEGAAVEMEKQRNAANARAGKAEAEVLRMKREVQEQAETMIEGLDTLAKQIAERFKIHLPGRGCEHDEW